MSEIAARYRKVASEFTARAAAVPEDAWDNQSPCEGWVARDIVRHLVEWMPSFFLESAGLAFPTPRSVDDDPVGRGAGSATASRPPSTIPRWLATSSSRDRAGTASRTPSTRSYC